MVYGEWCKLFLHYGHLSESFDDIVFFCNTTVHPRCSCTTRFQQSDGFPPEIRGRWLMRTRRVALFARILRRCGGFPELSRALAFGVQHAEVELDSLPV